MSKKLEGNGLWESSRMMLPQHKEQSMSVPNETSSSAAEPPTRKELELMREYILLPVALQIVEKRSIEVEMSSMTLKLLYSAAAKILARKIREDVQKSRAALLEKNIRLFEESKDDTALYYRYVCRGREDRFTMTKDFMRAEISARIGRYAKSLVATLQEAVRNKK
ncbi:hypothetical protein ACFQ88_09490 [Paenibacillus sp. NPDC056579]|uniref:hypothetical protein n=1 Tax=unclassified Paenibacillus TaxID=185978 RepID=UPI001EF806EC|nr:hypothetical protein [Paenibacillus sp. H1-7]ULL14494.1 hypothetical protein DVH26_08555 [Paenibacillus sp. H1-7]